MSFPLIVKDLDPRLQSPNLADYARRPRAFDWTKARALLDGLPEERGLKYRMKR